MRLVITQNITLDGVIDQDDRTGEWFSVDGHDTGDVEAVMRRFMNDETAQLHGRRTFEAMRGTLKDRPGGNLGVTGSVTVCHSLIAADLVDEYRLLVYPVVIGAGRRLFETNRHQRHDLNLIDAQRFSSGLTLMQYARDSTRYSN